MNRQILSIAHVLAVLMRGKHSSLHFSAKKHFRHREYLCKPEFMSQGALESSCSDTVARCIPAKCWKDTSTFRSFNHLPALASVAFSWARSPGRSSSCGPPAPPSEPWALAPSFSSPEPSGAQVCSEVPGPCAENQISDTACYQTGAKWTNLPDTPRRWHRTAPEINIHIHT